jgi:hypothetical protein
MTTRVALASPVIRWEFTASIDGSSLEGMPGRIPSSSTPAVVVDSRRDPRLAEKGPNVPSAWSIIDGCTALTGEGCSRHQEKM